MRAAIIDDEAYWSGKAAQLLREQFRSRALELKLYESGEQFLKDPEKFDLVLMDVELPGMDGFEALSLYNRRFPEGYRIILTVHGEMWKKGYELEVFRYIDKAQMEIEIPEALKALDLRLHDEDTVCLHLPGGEEKILPKSRILYAETERRNVQIHTAAGNLQAACTMQELERDLGSSFCRVHRYYLVNLNEIDSIEGSEIRMSDGSRVTVNRRMIAEVRNLAFEHGFSRALG